MPPSPKRKGRPTGTNAPASRRPGSSGQPPEYEPTPLRVDDPRPQRVAQYPSEGSRASRRSKSLAEEIIPTSVYDPGSDEELAQSYDSSDVSEPGFRQAFLYVERGPGAVQLVPLRQGTLIIGRASISELRLAHPSVSRRHAQLTRVGERFYVKDLGSQNGTLVNRRKIATEMELQLGDELTVGSALLKLRGPPQPGQAPDLPLRRKKAPAVASRELEPERERDRTRAGRTQSVLRVGVYGVLLGFGLAGVLAFALLKLQQGPSYADLQPRLVAIRPAAPPERAAATAVPGARPEVPPVAEPVAIAADEPVVSRLAPAAPALPTPAAQVGAGKSAFAGGRAGPPRAGSKESPVSARTPSRSRATEVAEREAEPRPPAPAPGPAADPNILSRYEDGDVAGALSIARSTGAQELVARLSKFQSTYEKARSALDLNDGVGAIQGFTAALKLDEQLSSGWSEYGVEIRTQLSRLYALAGAQHLKGENAASAKKAYEIALKYNPENPQARTGLASAKQALAAESGETEDTASASATDDAWTDPAPRAKPTSRSAKKSAVKKERLKAIDDAWGD